MRTQTIKKLFAFIITIIMFSIATKTSNAQIQPDAGGGFGQPCSTAPPTPTGLVADSISTTSAILYAITSGSSFTHIAFRYKSAQDSMWIYPTAWEYYPYIKNVDGVHVNSIKPGTKYIFQAQTVCIDLLRHITKYSPYSTSAYFTTLSKAGSLSATQLNVYPNPVAASGIISFILLQPEKVTLQIFDMSGRLIKTIANSQMSSGIQHLTWNATNENGSPVANGMYHLNFNAGNHSETKKISVIK